MAYNFYIQCKRLFENADEAIEDAMRFSLLGAVRALVTKLNALLKNFPLEDVTKLSEELEEALTEISGERLANPPTKKLPVPPSPDLKAEIERIVDKIKGQTDEVCI